MSRLQDIDDPLLAHTCLLALDAVEVLHRQGFHQVHALPYMAPSGMYWRFEAAVGDPRRHQGSRHILRYTSANGNLIGDISVTRETTPEVIAELIRREVGADQPLAEDPEYVRWYAGLLDLCREHRRLPVAFSDSWESLPGWEIGWCSRRLYPEPPRTPEDRLLDAPRHRPHELEESAGPGAYAWWLREDASTLAERRLEETDQSRLLYIGKSESSVTKRIQAQHLRRTRSSALRRSLAALLADELGLHTTVYRTSPEALGGKWGLRADGEQALTRWMEEHLEVSWLECANMRTTAKDLEKRLVTSLQPPLNGTHVTGTDFGRDLKRRKAELRDQSTLAGPQEASSGG